MTAKFGGTIQVTDELLEDMRGFDVQATIRGLWRTGVARTDGRLVYRRGGWYRLEGRTIRGRAAVLKEFM